MVMRDSRENKLEYEVKFYCGKRKGQAHEGAQIF